MHSSDRPRRIQVAQAGFFASHFWISAERSLRHWMSPNLDDVYVLFSGLYI
jgi:hypothetical protein